MELKWAKTGTRRAGPFVGLALKLTTACKQFSKKLDEARYPKLPEYLKRFVNQNSTAHNFQALAWSELEIQKLRLVI